MFLDISPAGGGRKRVSRTQVQKIKRGGMIADEIREMSNRHHEQLEIPQAERVLKNALDA